MEVMTDGIMQTTAPISSSTAAGESPAGVFWKHPIFIIVAVFFPIAFIVGRVLHAPVDDSYIFYVYARNLIEGSGLTFNGIRVEGYSSLLWMLMLSLGSLTGLAIPLVGEGLSALSGLFAMLMIYRLGVRAGLGRYVALIPVALTVATLDFVFYMSVGMETVLFAGFVALSISESLTDDPRGLLKSLHFPLILALMILIRPEGALVAGLLLTVLWFRGGSLLLAIRCGLTLTAMLVPAFAWRYFYYGDVLPNTWYAKGNAGLNNLPHGILYVARGFLRYSILPIVMIVAVVMLIVRRRPLLSRAVIAAGVIALGYSVYITIVGGDNMFGGRVWVPALPLIYVVLVSWNAALFRVRAQIIVAALVGVWLAFGFLLDPVVQTKLAFEDERAEARYQIAMYLRENYPPDTVIALNAAGIIPYYTGFYTVDMLGLNDAYLAHNGKRNFRLPYAHQVGDGAYVLSQNPDIIILGPDAEREPIPDSFIGDLEIWASPEFHANYEAVDLNGYGYGWVRKP